MGDRLKVLPGLCLGKMYISLSKFTHFGGSTLPGRLALGLSPRVLSMLASQLKEGCILITGTNGKTTTAHLLAGILSRAGKKIIHNGSGANLISGVTTAFVAESSHLGKINADLGVIEVDEASMPAVASRLNVKAALVTNLFPDQLDRFGELEHTLELISRGLDGVKKEGFLLLNADDPLIASIKKETRTIYYGLENFKKSIKVKEQAGSKICYHCGKKYDYLHVHFAHLGLYQCPGCGARRPLPHYSIVSCHKKNEKNTVANIKTPTGHFPVSFEIPGFYNLYNVLAAISCALLLGVREDIIKASLREFTADFGRRRTISIGGKKVELFLIKNPVGANEALRALFEGGTWGGAAHGMPLLLAVNDKYADGIDVSWLWDVDFEALSCPDKKIPKIFCSGTRGEEISLRLKYAGIDIKKIKHEEDLVKAFQDSLSCTPAGGKLQVLLTYTALQEMRKIVGKLVSAGD